MKAVSSSERSTRGLGGSFHWLVYAVALVSWSGPVDAATFVVDNAGDQPAVAPTNDGICDADPTAGVFCTLRAAIAEANGVAGPDIINFNILPAGAKTIVLGSFLPNITSVVTIDGTTQPGFVAAPPFAPVIELNAAAASSPLNLRGGSSGSTIRGLCINRAPGTAIRILESSNNVIVGNFIGTDLTGTAALGNRVGIYIGGTGVAANGNRVGGVAPADRNIISGNTPDDGIQINAGTGGAANNIVEGNYIGVDVSGILPLGNASQGVALFTGNSNSNNVVGGIALNAGNVISGNGNDGVLIADAGTTGTLVQGNRIGTNAAGTAPIPNFRGIEIANSAAGNTVGGPPGSQNLISGNTAQGILITAAGTTNNTVSRALIGTNAAGSAKIANGAHGVEINNGASNNTIGGATGTGNVISGNGFSGVNIIGAATSGNIILGNIIGLDQAGAAILSNTQFGLAIAQGSNANIVGNATGRNVISGNDMGGVRIVDVATDNNLVQSNYIGLDITGMLPRPNVANGVILDTGGVATGNRIGGVGLGNVISGNGSAGVRILNGMTGTLVVANIIGRNANNSASVPNGAGGVRIQASSGNTIGGTGARDGNVVAGNTGDGVAVVGVATGNAILGNRTFSNTGLGIDLIDDGPTANDGAKPAGQPNLQMDFPVFTAATQAGNLLDVAGYVGSAPGQALFANARVEVFKSDNDASGFGEGQILLGVVTSDASGNFSGTFDITGKGMVPGDQITGTATDTSNNTSELGANFGPAVTIAYSVGTDNTALYSDTASANAGTLTLNSAAANNIGVGDEIREGANRYYIVERNSATEFTIQDSAANGGTPGDTNISFGSTAITIFRAFNSLSAAEAASLDANHLATANLVAGNFQLSWPCYDDAPMNDMVSVSSYTTGPSNYIHIFTPTAASEVGTSQRHTGTAGTGFRLTPTASGSGYQIIELNTGYVRVEGVEIDGAGLTNALFVRGIRIPDGLSNVGDIRIDSCVIHGLHTTQNGFAFEGSMGIIDFQSADLQGPPMRVSNNIIYDVTNTVNVGHIAGIHIGSRATSYVYNNTVHSIINTGNACAPNCGPAWGIYSKAFGGGAVSVIATNNVCGSVSAVNPVQRCYDTQSGAGLTQTTNVSSDATGTAGLINQTAYATYFVNVTPTNEDLHILDRSLNLWGSNGTDLSGDPNLPVTDDIDGEGRVHPDIGADENVATRLYRSVGITATPLENGTTNAMTIVGSTATFASGLADNIGVGDAIEYDSDGNSTIDAIAFIHGRTTSTEYTVKDAAGSDPTAVAGDNDWSLFRAYTRLDDWESQSENANIDATVRNFDVSTDLVASNTVMMAACYGDGEDTTSIILSGWTTGPENYIKIYTPVVPAEVGTSQRHDGKWSTSAYRISNTTNDNVVIHSSEQYVRYDGLQVDLKNDPNDPDIFAMRTSDDGTDTPAEVHFSNNIVRMSYATPAADESYGILTLDNFAGANADFVAKVWNNIVYGFRGGGSTAAVRAQDNGTVYVFNNTLISDDGAASNSRTINGSAINLVFVKNNIAIDATDPYNQVQTGAGSENNVSDTGDAPPTGARNCEPTFVDKAGDDYHLAAGDTCAQDFGADLSADANLAFAMDIDFAGRTAPWDIGADDVFATTAVELVSFTARSGNGAAELSWETGTELDNLGFHLYRSLSEDGPYVRITATLIPGLGSSPAGANYAYWDSGLTNGVRYYYKLQDVETTGTTKMHGPIVATPSDGASLVEPGGRQGDQPGSPRIAYGKPWENQVRLRRSGQRGLVLELITEGFYAYAEADGTVRLEVPGLELVAEPGEPAVPVYRGWVEALVGRKVRLGKTRAHGVDVLTSLRPNFTGAPDLIASSNGTVRVGAKHVRRAFLRDGSLYPENPSQLIDVAFQGDEKKALVELAPLRWDANGGRLLLARRLEVRVNFTGREPSERLLDNGKRRRHVETHGRRDVLARFATREAGLHAVRFEDVFGNKARKRSTSKLRLSRQGETVAFAVTPNARTFKKGSTLYFVSDGGDANPFGHEAVYELEASRSGVKMEMLRAKPDGPPISEYRKTESHEENRLYQSAYLEAEDVWQWDWMLGPMTKSFPFQVTDLAASATSSRLSIWVQGGTDFPESPDHHVRAYVNGTLVAEQWWDGETGFHLGAELGAGVLREGENVLDVEDVGDTDAPYSMILLDRFDVSYPARMVTNEGRLEGRFDQSGAAWVSSADKAYVLDITGEQPQWLTRVNHGSGIGFSAVEGHRYMVVTPDGLHSPEIRKPLRTSLRSEANAAEYVVIGPRELLPAAEPLLRHRLGEGLQTKAVALQDIYSEFGYGEKTPESIREFLSYAFHHWSEPSLRYVLLVGDATYDPKDYLATGVENKLPAKLVKTRYLWTASDPWFAAVNGDDLLPDVAVGRLPASSVEELRTLVNKILAYETGVADPQAPIVLITDNADAAGDFKGNAEALATTVLSAQPVDKIYLSDLGTSATRNAIVDAFDDGASIMSYIGHGAIRLWADENLFNVGSVESLSPQSQQPILFTMNCLNGYFHFPYYDSLSERLLKTEDKGIIAAFSPTGLSLDAPAHRFHELLLEEVVSRDHARLGDAILAGQAAYADTGAFPELLSIYHLLGDPALTLR